jgi:hypothetical protein
LTLLFGFLLPILGEGCWSAKGWMPQAIKVFFFMLSSLSIYFLLIVFPILCAAWYLAGKESKKSFYLEVFLWGVLGLIIVASIALTPLIQSYGPA